MVQRAREWADSKVSYDQGLWWTDAATGGRYRQDCAGLVDMAWQLKSEPPVTDGPPGLTTIDTPGYTGAWWSNRLTSNGQPDGTPDWTQLQPGDALAYPHEHIVLFEKWIDKSAGTFYYIAEHEQPYPTSEEKGSTTSKLEGYAISSYVLLRYKNVSGGTPVTPPTPDPALTSASIGGPLSGTLTAPVILTASVATNPNAAPKLTGVTYKIDGTAVASVGLTGGGGVNIKGADYSWTFDPGKGIGSSALTPTPWTIPANLVAPGSHTMTVTATNATNSVTSSSYSFTIASTSAETSFMAGNQINVFGRGSDGHMHRWSWDTVAGQVYGDLGGTLASNPSGFYNSALSQYDVFGRGSDGALYHWYWNPSSNGWGIQNLGGNFVGNPVAIYNSALGQEDVFGRGPDGHLYHWFWNPSTSGWTIEDWGGDLAGNPSTYIAGPRQLDVFGRGSDGHMHRWSEDSGGNAVYEDLGGNMVGDPSGFYNGSLSQFEVFGRGTDGALYHWYWNPSSNGWQIQNWGGNFASSPTSFYIDSAGQENVFGRGPDGGLYRWSWDSTAGLVIQNWGGKFVGDPTGLYNSSLSQFDVFGRGTDGALYHWYWNPSSSNGIQDWYGDLG